MRRCVLPGYVEVRLNHIGTTPRHDIELVCLDAAQLEVAQLSAQLLVVLQLVPESPRSRDALHWHEELLDLRSRDQLSLEAV